MKVTPLTLEGISTPQLSLSLGEVYEVLAIEGDMYRILTDPQSWPYGNDPVLYESALFEVVDGSIPGFWVEERFEDGSVCQSPPEWKGCFFDDFHDGDAASRRIFRDVVKRYYPWTWKRSGVLDKDLEENNDN